MTDVNPPRRQYDSNRRQQQARQTRQTVLDEARRLFAERGYVPTTIADVARAAGVAVPTVYKVFTNKAGLLKGLFDVSVAGDDEPVAIADRPQIAAIIAEPSAAAKLTMYATHLGEVMPRVAPVQLLARDAAAADPAAAEVWAQTRREMLEAMTMFAADLLRTGQLRPDLTADDVRDLLWTFHSPEVFELLVLERGWAPERYARFLSDGLVATIVAAAARGANP